MFSRSLVKMPKNQQGLALLIMIIVIVLAFATYSLSGLSINQVKTDERMQTQAVLKKAKAALIAYAISNWAVAGDYGSLGKLPCPDYNSSLEEGKQDSNCGSAYANGIGYFPWRTLGIDEPMDASGSCLIYAVAPAYKQTPFAALNPDSYGQFQVVNENGNVLVGDSAESRPVAVIIAPGSTLSGQARNILAGTACGKDYDNIAAYLDDNGTINNAAIDTGAENVIDQFVQVYAGAQSATNPVNDRFVTISYDEVWGALQTVITSAVFYEKVKNLTEAIALCFAEYGADNGKHLPMPALLDLNGGEYRRDVDYDDSNNFTSGFAGRLPYDVSWSNLELSNANANYIFKNAYCDGIDLVSTPSVIENIKFSDDTGSDSGEYFDIWRNWKDHFFYSVSKAHKPSSAAVSACAGDCIKVGAIDYAGIVFFASLKLNAQQRYTSIFDSVLAADLDDDKDDMVNYLEDNRASLFPDDLGNSVYDAVSAGSNDIMFCINADMSVEAC